MLPALGWQAHDHPSDTLAKLSRAMLEDVGPEGDVVSLTSQIARMIDRFSERESYDVVLIDSRAGLSELAAPAMLGLGANVLLFGTAQRQTIRGYAALFGGLKLLAERDRGAGRRAEWRLLLKAVYAKASLAESSATRYRDDLYDLFADNLYDAEDPEQTNAESINFDIDDKSAPHWPLVIPFHQSLIDFDPVRAPHQLSEPFYEQAFRPFLDGVDSIVAFSGPSLTDLESQR